jgi:hypothetical protein
MFSRMTAFVGVVLLQKDSADSCDLERLISARLRERSTIPLEYSGHGLGCSSSKDMPVIGVI